jgi:hypothetical protein
MASIMQILRRIGGAKAPPTSGSAGQLALWKAGATPTDATSLYAHDGVQWSEILNTSGQWTAKGDDVYRVAGKVGMGVIPTTSKLEVESDIDGLSVVAQFNNVKNASAKTEAAIDIKADQASARISIKRDGGGSKGRMSISSSDGTNMVERIGIDPNGDIVIASGNVGIGTPTPMHAIDVVGNGAKANARFGPAGSTTGGAVILSTAANQAYWGAGWDYVASGFVATDAVGSFVSTDNGYVQLATGSGQTAGSASTVVTHIQLDPTGDFLMIKPNLIGYGTGAGGTVTQASTKYTPVTLNKPCGQIITAADEMTAGLIRTIQVNNSLVQASDTVIAHRASGGTLQAYTVWVETVTTGSFMISIKNNTAGPLSESITLNFSIIKSIIT